jgi:hypothetical protein
LNMRTAASAASNECELWSSCDKILCGWSTSYNISCEADYSAWMSQNWSGGWGSSHKVVVQLSYRSNQGSSKMWVSHAIVLPGLVRNLWEHVSLDVLILTAQFVLVLLRHPGLRTIGVKCRRRWWWTNLCSFSRCM